MSWIYANSATIASGNVVVSVMGGVDFSQVKRGWELKIGTHSAEIKSGTAPDGSGNSSITLVVAWDGASVISQPAKVVPNSGGMLAAVNGLKETNDYAISVHKALSDVSTLDADITLIDASGVSYTFASMRKNTRLIQELLNSSVYVSTGSTAIGERSAVIACDASQANGVNCFIASATTNSIVDGDRSAVIASSTGTIAAAATEAAVIASQTCNVSGTNSAVLAAQSSSVSSVASAVIASNAGQVSGTYSAVVSSSNNPAVSGTRSVSLGVNAGVVQGSYNVNLATSSAKILQAATYSLSAASSSPDMSGDYSAIIATSSCSVTGGQAASIASVSSSVSGSNAGTLGAQSSTASGSASLVLASTSGIASGNYTSVVASNTASATGPYSAVISSTSSSVASGSKSLVAASESCASSGERSIVGASSSCTATNSNAGVFASASSSAEGVRSAVMASRYAIASGENSAVMANASVSINYSEASGSQSMVLGCYQSFAMGNYSAVLSSNGGSSAGKYSMVMASSSSLASGQNAAIVSSSLAEAAGARAFNIGSLGGNCSGSSAGVLASQYASNETDYSIAMGYAPSGPDSVGNQSIRLEANGGVGRFAGGTTTTGFDYAEYFENLNNEIIPAGSIITLESGKIRKAVSGEFILGVVSKTYGVLGNSPDFCWHNRYLKGEWGEYLTEGVEYINDEHETRVHNLGKYERSGDTISITKTDVYQVQSKDVERWEEVEKEVQEVYVVSPAKVPFKEIIGTRTVLVKEPVSIIETVEFILINGIEADLDDFEVIDNQVTIIEVKEYEVFIRQDKVENSDYEDKPYSLRGDRPNEYTVVGLLGQLYVTVKEDITAAYVGADGLGTDSETPLRAMKMTTPFDAEKGYGVCFCLKK